jgi:hypothetical protein
MVTLASTTRSTTITLASPSAGPFDVDFRLLDEVTLAVYVDGEKVTSGWTLSATFVSGFTDSAQITFDDPLPSGTVLIIEGDQRLIRDDVYLGSDPNLPTKLNLELARVWAGLQEAKREGSRSVRLLEATDPMATPSDGQTIVWEGGKFVPGPSADEIAAAQGYAEAAAAFGPYANRAALIADTVAPEVQRVTYLADDGKSVVSAVRGTGTGCATSNAGTVVWIPDGVITPEHFGAPASGDCTTALDAMFAYAATLTRKDIALSARQYSYAGAGTAITGFNWNIDFRGRAEIRRSTAGAFLVLDIRTASCGRITIKNPRGVLTGVAAGSRGVSHVVNFLANPAVSAGAYDVVIDSPTGAGVKSVVNFTKTFPLPWSGGDPQLMQYFGVEIINPCTDTGSGATTYPEFGIIWESGTGNHNQVIGGNMIATAQAVKIGDGEMSVHDLTFNGTHFLGVQGGINIVGPADPAYYNQNVNLIGCQFDGASSGYTYRFENLQDFRVIGTNSQNAVDYILVNCDAPYTIEDNDGNTLTTQEIDAGILKVGGRVVVASGSGANGHWVRFADGTQECRHTITASVATATAAFGGFREDPFRTWTFPQAFTAAPEGVSLTAVGNTTLGVVGGTISTTALSFATFNIVSGGAATRTVSLVARGRWL